MFLRNYLFLDSTVTRRVIGITSGGKLIFLSLCMCFVTVTPFQEIDTRMSLAELISLCFY